jgi:hypothetical protein
MFSSWASTWSTNWFFGVYISNCYRSIMYSNLIVSFKYGDIQGVFKKRPNFCYKDFILQHFKHCPVQNSLLYWQYTVPNFSSSVGMLPGTHFLWWRAVLLSHFLNLRVFIKRPNFLNSAPTSTDGALRLLSAPSGRFWQQTAICPVSLWAQAVRRINPPTNSLCTCSVQLM